MGYAATDIRNDEDKRIEFSNDREALKRLFDNNPECIDTPCPSYRPPNFEKMYGLNSNPIAEVVSAPFVDETENLSSNETDTSMTFAIDALTVRVLGKRSAQIMMPVLSSWELDVPEE